jgi:hypothetical protein
LGGDAATFLPRNNNNNNNNSNDDSNNYYTDDENNVAGWYVVAIAAAAVWILDIKSKDKLFLGCVRDGCRDATLERYLLNFATNNNNNNNNNNNSNTNNNNNINNLNNFGINKVIVPQKKHTNQNISNLFKLHPVGSSSRSVPVIGHSKQLHAHISRDLSCVVVALR